MTLADEKHPLFQSVIRNKLKEFMQGVDRGYDPYAERLPGVSAYLLAHYLRREHFLAYLKRGQELHLGLKGWNELKTPSLSKVAFLSHPYFTSYKLFRRVWQYSQKVKKALEFKSVWFSSLFQKQPMICFRPPSVNIKSSLPGVGYGLFANEDMSKGTILGEYTGKILRWAFWNYRPGDYRFQYPTRNKQRQQYVIDAEPGGNWTRLVNHSSNPNIEAVAVFMGGILRMLYVVYQNVQKGEELTIDYGPEYWRVKGTPEVLT